MTTNTNANPLEVGSDEIERLALEECIKRQRVDREVRALVIPAGHCELAAKLARVGAQVSVLAAAAEKRGVGGRLLAAGLRDEVTVHEGGLESLPDFGDCAPFDIVIIRRGLCSLPYDRARQVVRQVLGRLKIGGKLYLSVLGLHSELAQGYAAAEAPITTRHGPLASALARKYDIAGPVCLYSERDLFLLLLESGASVLRTLTTTYGSVKGVAVRV